MSGRVWPRIVLGELFVLLLIGIGVAVLVKGASGADPADVRAAGVATMELSDVSDTMADHYRYARAHLADFSEIPCYCGCQDGLAHRHLADCFVNADGSWDPHASGCVVCTNEAAAVRIQMDAGTPIGAIRTSIIRQFGPPPGPTPGA